MNHKLLPVSLAVFLFCSISLWGQKSIEESYEKYFQDTREIPYLHLNKTSFFNGEEVWFQAYIVEQNSNQLHPQTSNLYLSVFDAKGKLKDQHLIRIKNGIGKGNFLIDSTFTDEKYYLKASTKWMKNFKENNAYSQRISIVQNGLEKKSTSLTEKEYYEFKLFPEGGHIIANSLNNIAFLIKDIHGKGVFPKEGIIRDQKGKIVKRFSTNQFGIGMVNLPFVSNSIYTFEATLFNGIKIKAYTPKPRLIGLSTNIEEKDDAFLLQIFTNSNSLSYLKNKQFTVFVHNSRKYIKFPFALSESTLYELQLQKKDLPHGVNIISIFNEANRPILERLIYHEKENLTAKVLTKKSKIENDSMQIQLFNNSEDSMFLSASFLPEATEANNPNQNLISSVFLKPYVRGYIQNPQYYFNSTNKNRIKDLQLLLMTQGWSKFNWKHIFKKPIERTFEFENGIDITGTFNKKFSRPRTYLLFSPENNIIRELSSSKNPFVLKNTFVKKNSVLSFGLKERDNIIKAAPSLKFSNAQLNDRISSVDSLSTFTELQVTNFLDIRKGTEVLPEIVIKAKKDKPKEQVYGASTMLRRYKMEDILIPSGFTVIDWLRTYGFNLQDVDGFKLFTPRRGFSSGGTFPGMNSLSTILVRVYLDDFEISRSVWMLENMYLDEFREIYFGAEPGRIGEVIYMYRVPPNERPSSSANYANLKSPVGFMTEKEYYSPKYPSYLAKDFKKYGALYWKPSIEIKPNEAFQLKIPMRLQNRMKLFLEGITSKGKFVSESKIF